MDSLTPTIIPLFEVSDGDEKFIGGKASKLGKLTQAGFHIPDGFSITTFAYQRFIKSNSLDTMIKFELGRKPFDSMRWEEIWDAALRIRSAFQRAEIPEEIRDQILPAFRELGNQKTLVVRSSAPKEDSAKASFAGLHESYIGIKGNQGLLDAVRLVWSSLWSDGALLYQHELGLDPLHSSMAVLVQELIEEDVSGVAFGIDPREPKADRLIIEAVPGLCRDLVDGLIDPSRWILKRSSGDVISMKNSGEKNNKSVRSLLKSNDLKYIYKTLQGIESIFGWHPDMEWTGRGGRFRLLQARPITTSEEKPDDEKAYYLTLRPGEVRLKALAKRVVEDLIPNLESEGNKLANEDLSTLNNQQLADCIELRRRTVEKWKGIYRDEFIPFAHGVRHLATYYNDAVQPIDPFEFVKLLKGQAMLSTLRNQKMMVLAGYLQGESRLLETVKSWISKSKNNIEDWQIIEQNILQHHTGNKFLEEFQVLLDKYMDVTYGKERINKKPVDILKTIFEMATSLDPSKFRDEDQKQITHLEQKLYKAVGKSRHKEAEEVLTLGRLSWRLRDDDNLLMGRIESQFMRALTEGIGRLESAGRLAGNAVATEKSVDTVINALRNPMSGKVTLPAEKPKQLNRIKKKRHSKPRQLIGQPASPGLISGQVRIIQTSGEFGKFKAGEILICDAIQPNMTHLVPLAGAIVERRGGMLIHGAIIAREMGIPCVNGVADVTNLLENGDLVTVDGYLGIVTVGEAEFDLENFNNPISNN